MFVPINRSLFMIFPRPLFVALALALVSTHFPALAAAPAPPTTPAPARADWRVLGEFESRGLRYLYVLVPKPENRAQLVALAEAIHQAEPDAWLWLSDSDEKIAEIIAANQAGDTAKLLPLQPWLQQHIVANSVLLLNPDRSRSWVLYEGATRETQIATLPCLDGKGRCKP